jgi:hypothetical protein
VKTTRYRLAILHKPLKVIIEDAGVRKKEFSRVTLKVSELCGGKLSTHSEELFLISLIKGAGDGHDCNLKTESILRVKCETTRCQKNRSQSKVPYPAEVRR